MALLKILVVTALAPDHAQVRFDRMGESLLRRLAPYVRAGVIQVIVEHATSEKRLARLVARHRPDVLHLSCHGEGTPRVLALEDRHGGKQTLGAEAFRSCVVGHTGFVPSLTVLEACKSLAIAQALVAPTDSAWAFPRVIGMADEVTPEHGSYFFETLYHMLASGLGLNAAITEARRDLEILAPGAVENPVLCRARRVLKDLRFDISNVFVTRGIAAEDQDERVFIDKELRGSDGFVGRDVEAVLGRGGRSRILHIHGEAGIGKTTLLGQALRNAAAQGWQGSARVFAFSFAAASRWRGHERLGTFFDEALEFFGEHSVPRDGDLSEAMWTQGLRLGRLVRREPSLVVLDDLPTLPWSVGGDDVRRLEAFVHPALAAFIREVARGGQCVCVFSTRSDQGRVTLGVDADVDVLAVEGLREVDGEALLIRSGMVDEAAALRALVARLRGHPLAITLVARSCPSVQDAERILQGRSEVTLAAVVDALASDLQVVDLLMGLRRWALAPAGVAQQEVVGELAMAVRQAALRAGFVVVPDGSTQELALAHGVLLEDAGGERLCDWPAVVRDGVSAGPQTVGDMLAAARAIECCRRMGAWEVAITLYIEKVATRVPLTKAHSFLAEELSMLAGFFEQSADRRVDWTTLRAEVPRDRRYARLFHRAGVVLRNLGQIEHALAPLGAALTAFEDMDMSASAADCASELALAQLWLDGSEATRVAARKAALQASAAAGGPESLCGMAGYLEWSSRLDQLERWGEAEGECEALDALTRQLDGARRQSQLAQVDRVAPGLEALARGRLAGLYARRRWSMPGGGDAFWGWNEARLIARREFAAAIAIFGATQHLWMLPMAYETRGRFRDDVLGDRVGAAMDRRQAQALASRKPDIHGKGR